MSKTIYDVGLSELLPGSFTEDDKMLALCAGFDAMNSVVSNSINGVLILGNIGNQPSNITDELAIEQQTPYYKQSFPLATRRALLANTGKINSIKGTKTAIEQTIRLVFGSATVEEWFEYSGDPFHFRVLVNEFPDSNGQITEVQNAVESVKPARSILDSVIITAAMAKASMYMAGIVLIAPTINVVQTA
jgi:P2-related tail formation protein